MSNNFTTSACAAGFNIINIILDSTDSVFRNTIPERFEISEVIGPINNNLVVRIISANGGDPVLRFSVDALFGISGLNVPVQTLLYATVSSRLITDTIRICNQVTTIYFEFTINIKRNVPGFLYAGDEYILRIGRASNDAILADVVITRTKSPFIVGPITA